MESLPFIEVHQPCPDVDGCGSSDAYSMREDGSGLCFSCGKSFKGEVSVTQKKPKKTPVPKGEQSIEHRSWRGTSHTTMKMYGVLTKCINGDPWEIAYPYYDPLDGTKVTGRKIRRMNSKDFHTTGAFKDAGLFGQHVFNPGSRDSITIFEGEQDAMAGYEMLQGHSACVSVKSGAGSAASSLKGQWDYVNSYDKIYFCFDNDQPGRDALESVAGLFDFKKAYAVKLTSRKDATEYIENDDSKAFQKTWKNARKFTPSNIISSYSDVRATLDTGGADLLMTYPFDGLNNALYGVFGGDIIVVKAPEGVGKTELFRSLEHHAIKSTDHPIGIIHLEEDNGTSVTALAGYELGIPATLPDAGVSKDDIMKTYIELTENNEDRVHFHSAFDIEDEDEFMNNIRFLASAMGCRIIFLDHISWLATGAIDDDERKKLDRISQKLKLLAKELNIAIFEISHVNDDGKTRGSRNITKVANTVISIHRDILAGSCEVHFLVEKARLGGRTGPAGSAFFDRDTGKLQ